MRSRIDQGMATLSSFVRDSRGQAVTEYILILGLIVAPIAVAFNELRSIIKDLLATIAGLLDGPGI